MASIIWSTAAAINIGLNYYLIPIYSIYGACFAMIFSYSLTFLMIIFFARKAYYVDYDIKKMLKVFIISILSFSLFFLGTSLYLLPIKIASSLIYIYIILRIIEINYKEISKKYIKRLKNN